MRETTSALVVNTSLEYKLTLNSFTQFPNQASALHPRNVIPTNFLACQMVVSGC